MEVEKPHPPLPSPPPVDQLWGFELPLGIYGDHRLQLGAGLFPLDFPRSQFHLGEASDWPVPGRL